MIYVVTMEADLILPVIQQVQKFEFIKFHRRFCRPLLIAARGGPLLPIKLG